MARARGKVKRAATAKRPTTKRAAKPTQAKPRAPADDLLAAIYANPDDDAPRLVYMDWLLEQGDPRGEFIGAQLARARGKQTREQARREKALLAEHVTAWLGPLASRLRAQDTRFERGFLDACTIELPEHGPVGAPFAGIDEQPAWATVRSARNGAPASDACHVPVLRELEVDDRGLLALARLAKPLAVERLAWFGPSSWVDAPHEADQAHKSWWRADGPMCVEAFERICVLPALRRLELMGDGWRSWPSFADAPVDWLRRVVAAPAAAHLESLALCSRFDLAGWVPVFEPMAIARFELHPGSEEEWGNGWRAYLERDAEGRLSRLRLVAGDRDPIDEPLALVLPAGLASVEVEVAAAARALLMVDIAQIERAARDAGVPVTVAMT